MTPVYLVTDTGDNIVTQDGDPIIIGYSDDITATIEVVPAFDESIGAVLTHDIDAIIDLLPNLTGSFGGTVIYDIDGNAVGDDLAPPVEPATSLDASIEPVAGGLFVPVKRVTLSGAIDLSTIDGVGVAFVAGENDLEGVFAYPYAHDDIVTNRGAQVVRILSQTTSGRPYVDLLPGKSAAIDATTIPSAVWNLVAAGLLTVARRRDQRFYASGTRLPVDFVTLRTVPRFSVTWDGSHVVVARLGDDGLAQQVRVDVLDQTILGVSVNDGYLSPGRSLLFRASPGRDGATRVTVTTPHRTHRASPFVVTVRGGAVVAIIEDVS